METLWLDLKYATRQLRKSPGFTSIVVITLALGIGANTAMFSLVDRALFRSLPYPRPDELVSLGVTAPIVNGEFLFAGNYLAWRSQQTAFSGLASSSGVNDCDVTEDRPVRLTCAAVSATFLPTFDVQPIVGRNFTPEEDKPSAPPVALVSYELWQSRFGGNSAIVDHTVSIDGRATRIVGVLPRDFEFPTLAHVGFMVPEALDETLLLRNQLGPVVRVYGRMKPGLNIESAEARLQPLFHDFVESAPPPFRKVLHLQVRSIRDLQIHDARLAAWLLLFSALAVFAVSCANVAGLVFVHSRGRQQELAVRSALGAGRLRLFQQRITENLLLAGLGCLAGCVFAYGVIRSLSALAPTVIPHLSEATLDLRSLLFAICVSIVAAVAFGTIAALERPALETLVVKTTSGIKRARMQQALLFGQVCVTVVLLAGSLLFLKSLYNLQHQPLGMDTQNIVTADITLGQQRYSTASERLNFYEALEQKLKAIPGVAKSALSDSLPPVAPARSMPFNVLVTARGSQLSADQGIGGVVGWRSVTPDYFSVLGIPLVRGRAFDDLDRTNGGNAIVVNEALSKRLFAGEDPIGKTIRFHLDEQRYSSTLTVVGVTANAENQGLGGQSGPEYYIVRHHSPDDLIFRYPDSQHISAVALSAVDPSTLAKELRDAVATIDPTIPVETAPLSQRVFQLAARPRFNAFLLTLFAALALLLAAVGIFGLISLLVTQSKQEIAIRMALGATPTSVVNLMVLRVSRWIVSGTVVGLVCSLGAGRWVQSLLFDVSPNDPYMLAVTALVILSAAAVAAYIPARRAAKVDPMVALRYE